jgi:hypothetical protein
MNLWLITAGLHPVWQACPSSLRTCCWLAFPFRCKLSKLMLVTSLAKLAHGRLSH